MLELPQRKRFATGVLGTYRKTLPKVLREESFFFFFLTQLLCLHKHLNIQNRKDATGACQSSILVFPQLQITGSA